MKKVIPFIAISSAFIISGFAQDDLSAKIEGIEVNDKGSTKWEPGVFLGLEANEGNTENLTVNAGFSLDGGWDAHELLIAGEGSYAEDTGSTITEKFDGEVQYNNVFDDPWYAYARAELNYDSIAQIDYRLTVSPGLGRYVVRNDVYDFAVEAGPGYLFEKVADVESDGATVRAAARYNRNLSDTSKLFAQVEYLPLIEDFGDYILDGQIGIEAAMGGGLSTRIAVKDRYDPEPGEGLEENDLQVIAGIIYKFSGE